jgi:putative tRNA adenosine deaminase-associated protein
MPVSYFTAAIGRNGSGWRALDVDLEDAETLDELGEQLRVAGDGVPVVAVIEHEDDWFALVRVDDDEDPRAFVSDLGATERSRYADLLSGIDGVIPLEQEAPASGPASTTTGPPEPDESFGPGQDEPAEPADGVDDSLLAGADADLAAAAEQLESPASWAGDPTVLADVGVSADELVKLVLTSSGDPALVLADLGERCGFDELLDSMR